ncbi:FtsX-like permease family protein [Aerolutibacter daejeonensis]|uniref:ABC transporter permease n=1 Tax=Aerolutibacter daejeonensis TaxID=346181 RepID=UPI001E38EB81|nr:ABC transporter permease [Lysobacter daejeonensis]
MLIGVTLVMAGVYRGMVDDGKALLDNSGADLWVVQQGTLGPYAESSSVNDDMYRTLSAMQGVEEASNITYLTMQVRKDESDVRAMVVGIAPGGNGTSAGWPPYLITGRQITRSHYEAVADVATGFTLGDRLTIRRNQYTVVGLTRRMVSSSGDPMVFIPLKDAQEAQFLRDNDAIHQSRRRTAENPAFNRPGVPDLLESVNASKATNSFVNAVLVRLDPGVDPEQTANEIEKWKRLTAYTRADMEKILIGKLIATSAKQIGMFLMILAVVSAAIVAFIIYTLTMDKIREIAVLKLIGTKNRTIAWMILQQSLVLGVIGFVVGKITATFAAPLFPKYVLLLPVDAAMGFGSVLVICALASLIAIRMALKVDPAEAIGG